MENSTQTVLAATPKAVAVGKKLPTTNRNAASTEIQVTVSVQTPGNGEVAALLGGFGQIEKYFLKPRPSRRYYR